MQAIDPSKITNKHLFSAHLRGLLEKHKKSQSDLAADIWGRVENDRGVLVAKNRDLISMYCSGRSLPNRETIEKIAKAFGIPVSELLPSTEHTEEVARGHGPQRMIVSKSNDKVARLIWDEADLLADFCSMMMKARRVYFKLGRCPTWPELAKHGKEMI